MSASLEDLFGQQAPGTPDPEAGELARAMVIAAHPDDADFGAAGAAALLARAGWEVRYLVVTDGSKGSDDPKFTTETLVATRDKEQRDAARILGVASVGFLGYTDGELTYSRELLGDITREIRAFKPHAVYTHDPEPVIHDQGFINHNDHRITGLATVDAVYPPPRASPPSPPSPPPRAPASTPPSPSRTASRRTRSPSCTCGAPTSRASTSTSPRSSTRRSRRCSPTSASSGTAATSSSSRASAGATRTAATSSRSAR